MTHDQVPLSKWQRLALSEAEREFPLKIDAALSDPSRFSATSQIPRLATLLEAAVLVEDRLESSRLGDLLALALDTFLTIGAGSDFRYYTEFLTDALQLINILESRGQGL